MKSRLLLKIAIFLLAKFSFYVIGSSTNSSEVQEQFNKFKDDYDRDYKNKFEEYKARKNFAITLKMIEAHNEAFENGEKPFRMDLNKFADQDQQKIRQITTNTAPVSTMTVGRAIGVLNETKFPPGPPSVDWRTSGCVTPVKDQSYFCNSCYAFSGVAALESQWCLKTGRLVTMSEQQIIDCSYNAKSGNWACGGGSPATAYVHIQNAGGIESDLTYPYLEYFPHDFRFPCKFLRSNVVAQVSGYWRIRSFKERELANIIAQVGPVSAAMNGSTPSFWYYSTGVYSDPQCTPSFSHAVLIVGYGTDYTRTPPMDYWLCKNSWSVDWGDNGYFKIQRGNNMCGITGYLIFPDIPTANISISTTTYNPLG